jgi:FMN-dependent NADH-azoreductase
MIFAVPLFNFGVSQHFKTWVDLVITDPRMGAGVTPATARTPAAWSPCTAAITRPALPAKDGTTRPRGCSAFLEDAWQLDLQTVETHFALVGVNPALDEFKELADQLRRETEDQARRHGRGLAGVSGN